jgi:hypothetical protein
VAEHWRKYVQFVEDDLPKLKTRRWRVQSVIDALRKNLGYVKWYGSWRCYVFFPFRDSFFEKQCLRDIAQFCEEQTELHRKKVRV